MLGIQWVKCHSLWLPLMLFFSGITQKDEKKPHHQRNIFETKNTRAHTQKVVKISFTRYLISWYGHVSHFGHYFACCCRICSLSKFQPNSWLAWPPRKPKLLHHFSPSGETEEIKGFLRKTAFSYQCSFHIEIKRHQNTFFHGVDTALQNGSIFWSADVMASLQGLKTPIWRFYFSQEMAFCSQAMARIEKLCVDTTRSNEKPENLFCLSQCLTPKKNSKW